MSGAAVGPQGQRSVVPAGTLDMSALLSAIEWPSPTSQEPVLVDMQDGTALVLGDRRQALTYGEVIGEAGPRLVSASRRLSSATRAAVETAEQTGHLVRLHPDSVKAFRELKPDQVKDAAGFVYSSLRGTDGKYRHVVRLKDVGKLQTLSSGAAFVSALAMQAQLDRIEKQLGQIQARVGEVQRSLDDSSKAKRAALDTLLGEIYRTAHESGQLTPAQWAQIAPIISDTYQLREETLLGLEDLVRKVGQLPRRPRTAGTASMSSQPTSWNSWTVSMVTTDESAKPRRSGCGTSPLHRIRAWERLCHTPGCRSTKGSGAEAECWRRSRSLLATRMSDAFSVSTQRSAMRSVSLASR